MWYFSYFIHPLYPSQRGGRLAFFREIRLNFFVAKGINSHVLFPLKVYHLPLATRFRIKKQKTAGDVHVPKRVYSHVVMCYWKKKKNKKKTISLTLLGYNLSVRLLTEALCVFLIPSFTLLRFHLGLLLGEMSITLPSRCYFCGFAFEKHLQAAIIRVHEYEVVGNGRLITNSDQTQSYTVNILNTIVILFRFFLGRRCANTQSLNVFFHLKIKTSKWFFMVQYLIY